MSSSGPSEQAVANAPHVLSSRKDWTAPNQSISLSTATVNSTMHNKTFQVKLDTIAADLTLTLADPQTCVGVSVTLVVAGQNDLLPYDVTFSDATAAGAIDACVSVASAVYEETNSNGLGKGSESFTSTAQGVSSYTLTQPARGTRVTLECSGTRWYITGLSKRIDVNDSISSDTTIAAADNLRRYSVALTSGDVVITMPAHSPGMGGSEYEFVVITNTTGAYTLTFAGLVQSSSNVLVVRDTGPGLVNYDTASAAFADVQAGSRFRVVYRHDNSIVLTGVANCVPISDRPASTGALGTLSRYNDWGKVFRCDTSGGNVTVTLFQPQRVSGTTTRFVKDNAGNSLVITAGSATTFHGGVLCADGISHANGATGSITMSGSAGGYIDLLAAGDTFFVSGAAAAVANITFA